MFRRDLDLTFITLTAGYSFASSMNSTIGRMPANVVSLNNGWASLFPNQISSPDHMPAMASLSDVFHRNKLLPANEPETKLQWQPVWCHGSTMVLQITPKFYTAYVWGSSLYISEVQVSVFFQAHLIRWCENCFPAWRVICSVAPFSSPFLWFWIVSLSKFISRNVCPS